MCANHGRSAGVADAHSRNRSVRNTVCECSASYWVRHRVPGAGSVDERAATRRARRRRRRASSRATPNGSLSGRWQTGSKPGQHPFVSRQARVVGRAPCGDRCSCRCSRRARVRSRGGGRRARRCRGGRRAACRSAPTGGSSGTCPCRARPGSARRARPGRNGGGTRRRRAASRSRFGVAHDRVRGRARQSPRHWSAVMNRTFGRPAIEPPPKTDRGNRECPPSLHRHYVRHQTQLLPLLPLTQGVVLPQMVVTIALETDEAKRAGAAAADAGDRIVLVPRVDGRFAAVGTIAAIESAGDLPNGPEGPRHPRHRPRPRRQRRSSARPARCTCRSRMVDEAAPTPRARELAREYRAVVETILEHRGARRIADVLAGVDDPGQLADTAATRPS